MLTLFHIPAGSVSPGDMLAVCKSEAVLPQQLAHLPPELPLAPEGTATQSLDTRSISVCSVSESNIMAVLFRSKYFGGLKSQLKPPQSHDSCYET